MTEVEVLNNLYKMKNNFDNSDLFKKTIDEVIKIFERVNADGCVGCAYEAIEEWELPCAKCKRKCKDYWRR